MLSVRPLSGMLCGVCVAIRLHAMIEKLFLDLKKGLKYCVQHCIVVEKTFLMQHIKAQYSLLTASQESQDSLQFIN